MAKVFSRGRMYIVCVCAGFIVGCSASEENVLIVDDLLGLASIWSRDINREE